MKVTVPVGVPAPGAITMAVSVSACPNTAVAADARSAVVVAAGAGAFTCSVGPWELGAKLAAPLWGAVMAGPPGVAKLGVNVAVPSAGPSPRPRITSPSMNTTVPVGAPLPAGPLTVAVNVTACPTTA